MLLAVPDHFRCVSVGEGDRPPPILDHWPFAGSILDHVRIDLDRLHRRNVVAARIDSAVARADRAVLVVAHGVSCAAVSWWAKLSPHRYVAPVAGALLIAPRASAVAAEMFAAPGGLLPFPSIVLGDDDASQHYAQEWGSRLIDGPLPREGASLSGRLRTMMFRFTSAIVEADARAAQRLISAMGDG